MGGGGWRCKVKPDTSRLHQSLRCEQVELPNSAFSGVRAAVIDSLEKQIRLPATFDQDALVSSVGSKQVRMCASQTVNLTEMIILHKKMCFHE